MSEHLYINKNITLAGSPFALIDAQGTSQTLQIDNPRASVNVEKFVFIRGNGGNGGAITSQARSLTIKDCRFSDNFANYGAAIYQKGGNLQIMDSTFEQNNATMMGAAIYDEGGNMQVGSSKFTHNPESRVIYFNGAQLGRANLSIRDCNISNNSGPYNDLNIGFGGAIVCENSTTLIDHCAIKGNKALVKTPTFLGGNDAGMLIAGSDVTLNDTLIERNEAFFIAAIDIVSGSKVKMNRCVIKGNHAIRTRFFSEEIGGEGAGISLDKSSDVTTNDVTIEDNIADGNIGAIGSAGKLNLGKGTVITRNIAKVNSALNNTESGMVNMSMGAHIYDNHDKQQPYQPVHIEGALNIDSPEESLKGDGLTETTIALRAENNRYVSLNVRNDYLYANRGSISDSKKLHLVGLGDDKVTFRGANGKYVGFRVYTGETYFIDSNYPECYVDSMGGAAIFKKYIKVMEDTHF